MTIRRAVVIHFTSGATALSSINFWKEPQCRRDDIGAHLIIDRDGKIYQCRPFNRTISHAGKSRWRDPRNSTLYTYCNAFTIGIELANAGDDDPVIKTARRLPGFAGTMQAKHRNGGPMEEWEIYPEAQLKVVTAICQELVKQYHLDDITGHDCIAPERKNDPGPAFPMEALRKACGFEGLPAVHNA